MKVLGILLLIFLAHPALASAQSPKAEVRVFTSTRDLNLSEAIHHAINFGGQAPMRVGGALFQPDHSINELELHAEPAVPKWGPLNRFPEPPLNELMHSMRWAEFPGRLSFQLSRPDPEASYRLQLLFAEKCCERGFDILIDEETLIKNFSPAQLGGSAPDRAIVVSTIIEPALPAITITLVGKPSHFPDPSPVIQAATLEQLLPKNPETLPLLSIRRAAQEIRLSWTGQSGIQYEVEYSEQATPMAWRSIGDTLIGAGPLLTFRDSNPARLAKTKGFYRLRQRQSVNP